MVLGALGQPGALKHAVVESAPPRDANPADRTHVGLDGRLRSRPDR